MTTVTNLATSKTLSYSCSPREAVIAAYAQENRDFNTWQYAERYSGMVQETPIHVMCGDWVARRADVTPEDITAHVTDLQNRAARLIETDDTAAETARSSNAISDILNRAIAEQWPIVAREPRTRTEPATVIVQLAGDVADRLGLKTISIDEAEYNRAAQPRGAYTLNLF